MDYKEYVEDLRNKCDAFLAQVESIGNECAWTDRALENILAAADELRQVYYGPEVVSEKESNPWLIMSDTVIVRHSYSAEECAKESWKASCFDVLEFDDEIGCDEYPGKVYVALYQVDVDDPLLSDMRKDVLVACGLDDMMDHMDEISPELWAKEFVQCCRGYFNPIGYAPEGDDYLDKYMITNAQLNDVLVELGAPEELIEHGDVSRLVGNAASKCGEMNGNVAHKSDVNFDVEKE